MPQPTSKARLVITALVVDHQSRAEVAARYGLHRAWVYKLKARYEAEGDAALEPRSRRPETSPTALDPALIDLIVRLRKCLPSPAWTTAPTPSPGTWTTTKDVPGEVTDPRTHDRVRHDRVDKAGSVTLRHNGRLHHIGIGRTYEGTCVILLVQDLQIRVVNAITGELLRELLLNPHTDYQPTGAPKGPTRK